MFIHDISQNCIKGNTLFISPYVSKDGTSRYEIISKSIHHNLLPSKNQIIVSDKTTKQCETLFLDDYLKKHDLCSYKNIIVLPYKSTEKNWNASAIQILMDFSPLVGSKQLPLYRKDKVIKEGDNKVTYEKMTLFNIKEFHHFNKHAVVHSFPEFANFYREKAYFYPIPGINFGVLKIDPDKILDHQKLKEFYELSSDCVPQETQSETLDWKLCEESDFEEIEDHPICKKDNDNKNTIIIVLSSIAVALLIFAFSRQNA